VIAQDVISNDVHVRFKSGPGHPVNWRTAEKMSEHFEVEAAPVVNYSSVGVQSS
jgi:hypothetical protein